MRLVKGPASSRQRTWRQLHANRKKSLSPYPTPSQKIQKEKSCAATFLKNGGSRWQSCEAPGAPQHIRQLMSLLISLMLLVREQATPSSFMTPSDEITCTQHSITGHHMPTHAGRREAESPAALAMYKPRDPRAHEPIWFVTFLGDGTVKCEYGSGIYSNFETRRG